MERHKLDTIAHKLLERIEINFHRYGGMPNSNQLLAMACNPLTASLRVYDLTAQANFIIKHSTNSSSKLIAKMDHRQKIKEVLLETMHKVFTSVQAEAEEEAEVDSTEAATEEEPQVPEAAKVEYNLAECYDEVIKGMSPTNDLVEDTFDEEVNHYFDHKFNWACILKNQGVEDEFVKEIGTDSRSWLFNFDKICKGFDIMEWWEDHGKDKFPKIYVIACLILALPDSNGNQERTFSACTWMDGKLKKNQGEGTFQTKCVLHKTKKVREQIAKHTMEDKEICTRKLRRTTREATCNLLEVAFGVDEEDEHTPAEESKSEVEAIEPDNESLYLEDDLHKKVMPESSESEEEDEEEVEEGDNIICVEQ